MEANSSQPSLLLSLIPLLIVSVVMAIVAYLLAKDKGRNVNLWTILAVIPVINFFFIWYFVGATNIRLEKKVDQLLDTLAKRSAPLTSNSTVESDASKKHAPLTVDGAPNSGSPL